MHTPETQPTLPQSPLLFKKAGAPGSSSISEDKADEQLLPGQGGGKLVCVQCRATITTKAERTSIKGDHNHVFCNPSGYIYEIGCFANAPGCTVFGPSSLEFTWFPGHAWQVSLCRACQTQIGWRFSSAVGRSFFGLILDLLDEEESDD